MTRIWYTGLLMCCVLAWSGSAMAETQSEHVDWGRWSFDWEVRDNQGLALRNVKYADELILAKASMPVVRVKYVKEMVWW
ncbi:MAG: copper amine oxidase, partial [Nitrospira sp.]